MLIFITLVPSPPRNLENDHMNYLLQLDLIAYSDSCAFKKTNTGPTSIVAFVSQRMCIFSTPNICNYF